MIAKSVIKYKFLEMAIDYFLKSISKNFRATKFSITAGSEFSKIEYTNPEWPEINDIYYDCRIRKIYTKKAGQYLAFSHSRGITAGLEVKYMEFTI